MLEPSEYYRLVRNSFRTHGQPETAQGQIAYMRNQFDYFGLKMPAWTSLTKEIHTTHGIPGGEDLKALARLCFQDEHREMHYFALETIQKSLKKQPADFIDFLEELIRTRSWWDSVDWLAKLVGIHFRQFPDLIQPVTRRWMDSGYLWLQRVSIIFQLAYKEKTDAELMFGYIRELSASKEFFIQKAAGWALRQYSRTNPALVQKFIESTKLAPLTHREGMRLILKSV